MSLCSETCISVAEGRFTMMRVIGAIICIAVLIAAVLGVIVSCQVFNDWLDNKKAERNDYEKGFSADFDMTVSENDQFVYYTIKVTNTGKNDISSFEFHVRFYNEEGTCINDRKFTNRGSTITYFEGRTMKSGESFNVKISAKKSDASKYKTVKVEEIDLDSISQSDVTLAYSTAQDKTLFTCLPLA